MKKKLLLTFSFILFFQSFSLAASITQAKGQKALIALEGDEVHVGDEFFLLNSAGKKVAIIRIKQVTSSKALADILKGKADVGFTLQAKASSTETTTTRSSHENASAKSNHESLNTGRDIEYLRTLKDSYGLVGEYLMNTMSVSVKNTATVPALTDVAALKDTSFGLGGFYDYVVTPDIAIQVAALIEQIKVTGTANIPGCAGGTSTNCDVNITYGSFYGLGKYYLTENRYRIWAGIGGGFLLALSKSSTALNESQISTNQILTLAIGSDIQMSRKNYIPVTLQYNYFPPTDTVKATSIVLKAGWAWNQR